MHEQSRQLVHNAAACWLNLTVEERSVVRGVHSEISAEHVEVRSYGKARQVMDLQQ